MLTNEVKQRINTCRDILVGKLPDPKSQVIQITNALIYKFMDDQDRLSEKMGGKASFFTGALKPYAWHKLFDSKLTNQERADLYVTGIERLSGAQNLPELFREIFKEAYVPFKAAGTITLFIEEINKFSYHHSEELGNAYEYLLSIMGSQGDAGQFRTPRHIIEFMVDVIDPQKTETVYDPACGTAGFLIAAYTHIAEANNGKLTASDKKKLAENISGIDISPDMAKMARVNLYLHGFTSPVIDEGDTLSDEDLWGTKYDVILANPPFMSPKGGIIPHDKFGVKANRAEVLFVDYIAEHLKLKGRAAIVVPEGVIFQSGTSYKALRKMLVEGGYLHSVISLPAGVFQPYSGVKTSILILDRERAKEATEVLFLKIDNDGLTMGTQRTDRSGSQLSEALAVAHAWKEGNKQMASFASWVGKNEIVESGDYNLSGERYRVFETHDSTWPVVELGDVVEVLDRLRKPITKSDRVEGRYPYYGATGIVDWVADYIFDERLVLVGEDGAKWSAGDKTAFIAEGKYWVNNHAHVLRPIKDKVSDTYLVSMLNFLDLNRYITGVTVPKLNQEKLRSISFPLPPIEVQQEIVTELDRYQKIIDGARQVIENYKPSFRVGPAWPVRAVEEVAELEYGIGESAKESGEYRYIRITDIGEDGRLSGVEKKYIEATDESKKYLLSKGDVLVARTGATFGKTLIFEEDEPSAFAGFLIRINLDASVILPKYFWCFAQTERYWSQARSLMTGGGQPQFNANAVKKITVPVPTLEEQQTIIDSVLKEEEVVNQNKYIVKIFEQKIQDKIAEVWGE